MSVQHITASVYIHYHGLYGYHGLHGDTCSVDRFGPKVGQSDPFLAQISPLWSQVKRWVWSGGISLRGSVFWPYGCDISVRRDSDNSCDILLIFLHVSKKVVKKLWVLKEVWWKERKKERKKEEEGGVCLSDCREWERKTERERFFDTLHAFYNYVFSDGHHDFNAIVTMKRPSICLSMQSS